MVAAALAADQKIMVIEFTIQGNQNDSDGNPIPKARKTLRQQWTPEAKRYAQWKEHVVKAFMPADKQPWFRTYLRCGKPIDIQDDRARMDIRIFWKNGAHGDPENVFGSIADALFVNDKNLDGSFESARAPDGKGRVEVIISINQ